MTPEDTAERLARGMVRDATAPQRNLVPPDAGAIAKLRGAVARARWEGRQDELLEVLGACQEYLNQDPPDVDGFLVSVHARAGELECCPVSQQEAEAAAAQLARSVAQMAGKPGEIVVIARISAEPDGRLNYFWEWYWRPTEIITEPAPGGHDLRRGAVMLEMMVVTSGAAMMSRLRAAGVPYPVAVMVALQVAYATGLALMMASGGGRG